MKQKLKDVLESEHITKVIYVDDSFGLNKDKVLEEIYIAPNIVNDLEGWHVGAPLDQEFERWWNETDEGNRITLANKLGVAVPFNKLYEILEDFPLELLTPQEFKVKYIDCKLNSLSDNNRIILLMDRDLKLEDGRTGESFLELYQDNCWVYSALFSQTFTIAQEMEEWKHNRGFYPLAKDRVMNTEMFMEGLRNILWVRHIDGIRENMTIYFREAVENVFNHAAECDPYAFDHAVMASSAREGCWEYETLLRLYLLQLELELRRITLVKFPELQNAIESLRNINSVAATKTNISPYLNELRKVEIFEDGEYINKIHAPIDNGDIFEINGNKYIFLSQPCNLALRKDGLRKTYMGYLLLITECSRKKPNELFVEFLNYNEDNKYYKVQLSGAFPISTSVLDLTSFSDIGEAVIDCSAECNIDTNCQPNLKLRYADVCKEFTEVAHLLEGVKEDMRDTLNSYFCKLYYVSPTIENAKLTFPIKRIKRYRAPYAQVLLQCLTAYQSRVGFSHDFTK